MESRIVQLMEDKTLPHSDQQLLDQELDDLLQQMDFRAMADFEEPEDEGCLCCMDCGCIGDMNIGSRILCDICVDNKEEQPDCSQCAGCAYCMASDGYEGADEI